MSATGPRMGALMVVAVVVLVSVLSSAAQTTTPVVTALGPPVELSCSVFVSGDWDYTRNISTSGWTSSCTQMVERVRERCGGSRINFVPTHYWQDPGNGRGDPTATYQPTAFCYKFSTLFNIHGDCKEPTAGEIAYYQSNMTQCFKKAVELGFDIEVTPHLDDGLGQGGWRNALDFDPMVKYGNWSYNEIMLTPLIKALGDAAAPNTTVYFAMTGEMSLTVVKYPTSYATLATTFKDPTFGAPANLQMGVSMNFNKLYTVVLTPEIVISQNVPAAEFQQMCEVMDFIGISSYSSWKTGFKFGRKQMEAASKIFMKEVANLGVDLDDLINVKGKRFHLSEYGIGGGTCGSGTCKASTAEEVSDMPYYGIYGPYETAMDPWQGAETSRFRGHFYNRTLQWLRTGGGPTIRVDAAYVWNLASWDFAGIHPESSSVQGSYYSAAVSNMVKIYNDWVAAQRAALGTPIVPVVKLPKTPTMPAAPDSPDTVQDDFGPELPLEPIAAKPAPSTVPASEQPATAPNSVVNGPGQPGSANNQNGGSASKVGSQGKSSKGMKSSSIIAVAAVVCVVVFIVIASVVYVVWRMRQRKAPPPDKGPEAPAPQVSAYPTAPTAVHDYRPQQHSTPPLPSTYRNVSGSEAARSPRGTNTATDKQHTVYARQGSTQEHPSPWDTNTRLDQQDTIHAL